MGNGVKFLKPKDFANLGEEWTDVYLEVKNIRKGDVFYECERGSNYRLVALTSARRISDGWYCIVENSEKEKFEIFMSEMTNRPGPNLFWEPQFVMELEKEIVYMIE